MPNDDLYLHAHKAIDTLKTFQIAPKMEYYAVVYGGLSQTHPAISTALNALSAQSIPLTLERLDYLFATYCADKRQDTIDHSISAARKLLTDLLQALRLFSDDNGVVDQAIETQIEKLTNASDITTLQHIAHAIIAQSTILKDQSSVLRTKLEHSHQEIEGLRETLAKAASASEYDFLTNVYNRKALEHRLSEAIRLAKQEQTALTVLMIDVDHFKQFNDKYGHLIGDEVLKIVARSLTDTVKGMDIVARYGGEEFTIILPKTPISGGIIVAESIRKTIATRELKRRTTGETYGTITVSIGITALQHLKDDTHEQLIERADKALYQAKNNGRNCIAQQD